MRDYGKVSPKFWIGSTGKALRKQGVEAQLVGLYLLTAPLANMLGLYYMPIYTVAGETGLGLRGASKGLQGCIQAGFCRYDEDSEMVWVVEMAHYQIADRLERTDKRSKGVQSAYDDLLENPFLGAFFDKYKDPFNLTHRRGIEGACKPLASQEQEQEQEKEQEQKQDQEQTLVDRRGAPLDRDVIPTIFAYWQKTMHSPTSKLDAKRIDLIRKALKMGYEPRQLCEAILGCSRSPHHMGENDRGTKYNGLGLILRNAEYIDKFIELASKTTTGPETLEQKNSRIIAEFMADESVQDDPNIIDMEES